jgi:hypothetical protein
MNHELTIPQRGVNNWHVPINGNFEQLDRDVEIRDLAANRDSYEPKQGALFRATDTGNLYRGTGSEWIRQDPPGVLVDWASITDFNAGNDGDDASATLKTALESVRNVYIPQGSYRLAKPLKFSSLSDRRIFGSGTLRYPQDGSEYMFEFEKSSGIEIYGISFDGNEKNTNDYGAVRFVGCSDISVRNCQFYSWGNSDGYTDEPHTVATRGSDDVDILYNSIVDSGGKGISVYAFDDDQTDSIRIIGNRTKNTDEEGIFAGTEHNSGTTRVVIAHNDIDTTKKQYGMRIGGLQPCNALITGNTIRNTYNAAIEVKSRSSSVYTITNNVVTGNNGINIRSVEEPLGGVIANNSIVDCNDSGQGIRLLSGCENVVVSGNYANQIEIDGGDNFSIFGNYTYGNGITARDARNVEEAMNIS